MVENMIGGRYQVTTTLGRGAFGRTYLAEDTQLPSRPQCVVKQLMPAAQDEFTIQEAKRLFNIEAEVLAKLFHPQVPRLLAHYPEEFSLVQEFVDGHDLSKEVVLGKQLTEAEVIAILLDVLPILEFIHSQKVIHRDLKPANIMRRNSDGKLILIDFGAVKQIQTMVMNSQGGVDPTVAVGTVGYMPPEQLKGRPRNNSDIYALGTIAIQALTGILPEQLPEDPNTGGLLWKPDAEVGNKLGKILDHMVLSDPHKRYQSAREVINDLETITGVRKPWSSSSRLAPNWRVWVPLGLVGLVIVGGIVFFPRARTVFLANKAHGLVEAEEYTEALALYEELLETHPQAKELWLERGYVLSQLKRTEEMSNSCEQALEIDPEYVDALICQGLALTDSQQYEEALVAYEKALELRSDDYIAWDNMGETLIKLQRPEEALEAIDEAILYKDDYLFAWNNRGNALFLLERYPEAIASYSKAIELEPNYQYAWNGRGNARQALQRHEKALQDYEKAIAIDEKYYEAWYGKALTLLDLAQPQKALAALEQAIDIKADYQAAIKKREEVLQQL
ncbi:MAG: tetratricopeptide repeat protein [Spirulinaceae cyanobacterium]